MDVLYSRRKGSLLLLRSLRSKLYISTSWGGAAGAEELAEDLVSMLLDFEKDTMIDT